MKGPRDLVRTWLRKADSDLAAVKSALDSQTALDTACFHAQHAAEKLLKGYLLAHGVEPPYTHNLARLVLLCQAHDGSFSSLLPLAELLTPYAVELRYDLDFWPSAEFVTEARDAALVIRAFVLERLPMDMLGEEA